jgi:sugar O-acyltransferase (sialic acid O-acetyltransferase NeuD family)
MNKEKLILIGAGGHAESCIDVIEQEDKYEISGLIGLKNEVGQNRLGYKVIGTNEDVVELSKSIPNALITIGYIKTPNLRVKLFESLKVLNFKIPTIISPYAKISPHATLGIGTIVMHGSQINVGAKIGNNCIINSRALIEHGVSIGNHCHISTGAIINGNVSIGGETFIGSGAVIKQGLIVGDNCVIGMGLSIIKNLSSGKTYLSEVKY